MFTEADGLNDRIQCATIESFLQEQESAREKIEFI